MVPYIGKQYGTRSGNLLNPWLPPQLYAESNCSLKPLGNWEGRAQASTRKPGNLPLPALPNHRTGRSGGADTRFRWRANLC